MPHTGLVKQQLEFIARHISTTYFIAVVDIDGFRIAGWTSERFSERFDAGEEDRVAPMSAAIWSLGDRITSELGGTEYKYGILQGDGATIFNIVLSEKYMLTFGVREIRTIDSTLVILQQWWGELLSILEVSAPKL